MDPAEAKFFLLYDLDVVQYFLRRSFLFYLKILDAEKYVTNFSILLYDSLYLPRAAWGLKDLKKMRMEVIFYD